MKKFCLSCTIFLSFPIIGLSNILGNLSGDVGIEYRKQETQSDTTTKTDNLSQVLNFNYRDYLYDKRVLDYYFNLKFSKIDEDGIDNNRNKSSTYENVEYDINLNFLQKSFMPFTVKAKHTQKPSTIINEDSIVETIFDKTNYSLRGRIQNSYLDVDYNASMSQSDTSSQLGNKLLDSNIFGLNFSKEFKDESRIRVGLNHSNTNSQILYGDMLKEDRNRNTISTSYSNKDFNFNLNYTQKNEEDKDINGAEENSIDIASTSLRYNFSDDLSINSTLETEKNEKNVSTNNSANFRLRWNPSKSYDANLSLDANEYNVKNEAYNNYGLNLSSNYKINENWSNSQNLNFIDVVTPASTHTSFFLSTTTSYNKDLSEKTKLYANNTTSYIQSDNTSLIAASDIDDDNTFIINSSVGINRKLGFWNARNGYDLNYVKSFTSDNSDTQEIKLSTYLNTFPLPNIEYNLEADVSSEDKNENKKMVANIKNLFKFSKNIDVRGRVILTTALNYKFEKEEKNTIKSFEPSLSLAFNYRLWRTLSFKSLYDIMIDELNKTTNHKFNAGIHYKFREFEIDLTSEIIKQYKKEDDDFMTESVFLGMKRKF